MDLTQGGLMQEDLISIIAIANNNQQQAVVRSASRRNRKQSKLAKMRKVTYSRQMGAFWRYHKQELQLQLLQVKHSDQRWIFKSFFYISNVDIFIAVAFVHTMEG